MMSAMVFAIQFLPFLRLCASFGYTSRTLRLNSSTNTVPAELVQSVKSLAGNVPALVAVLQELELE